MLATSCGCSFRHYDVRVASFMDDGFRESFIEGASVCILEADSGTDQHVSGAFSRQMATQLNLARFVLESAESPDFYLAFTFGVVPSAAGASGCTHSAEGVPRRAFCKTAGVGTTAVVERTQLPIRVQYGVLELTSYDRWLMVYVFCGEAVREHGTSQAVWHARAVSSGGSNDLLVSSEALVAATMKFLGESTDGWQSVPVRPGEQAKAAFADERSGKPGPPASAESTSTAAEPTGPPSSMEARKSGNVSDGPDASYSDSNANWELPGGRQFAGSRA